MAKEKQLSQMMQHYVGIKEKYQDCIVFYRLGDFYEMFFDDAIKVSKMLDLTLTGRDCGLDERAPMCGIPYHAADEYIAKLVGFGEKVAICEQLSDPKAKGLVERDVIKIVTAGTITNNELIDDKSNNFLASVYLDNDVGALSWSDITTGEFYTRNFTGEDVLTNLINELIKINPAQIIGNGKARDILNNSPFVVQKVIPKADSFAESEFDLESARFVLLKHFKVANLFSAFNINENDCCVSSSGALISYFKQTQKNLLSNIEYIKLEDSKGFMMLDSGVIRNLELTKTLRDGKRYGSLLWLLDKTKTSMGARKIQAYILSPLNDIDKINYRLDGVESFFNNTLTRESIADSLSDVKDIGRITGKISNGNLTPKDCLSLAHSLEILPNLKLLLSGIKSEIIKDIYHNLGEFDGLVNLLTSAIYEIKPEDGKEKKERYIKTGYNAELDELRDLLDNGTKRVLEMEALEREKTGIKNLRITYNRIFGYNIEITNSFKDRIPYNYIRRQTLANSERFVTEELKELEEKILSASEKSVSLELQLYNEIKANLVNYVSALLKCSDAIAELDVLIALSTVAREHNYVRPIMLAEGNKLNIVKGRHPVVEVVSKQRFISNDCVLDNDENRTMIITGPNMAGKSTYMRQVAIITLLAHIGSFVPATEAQIPLTDKIFTRIGASDNLISDQSTFMVEMSELANIIKNATKNSLVLLDEIGRGTSTYDGLSIAWSTIEYVTEKIGAKTLFATHYHELTKLEGQIKGVKNYKVTVQELNNGIVFLREIKRGSTNKSFGIEVAEIAGVNKEVTERAKNILDKIVKTDKFDTDTETEKCKKEYSEVENIIKDINIDNLTPIQAFNVLVDLNEKVKGD